MTDRHHHPHRPDSSSDRQASARLDPPTASLDGLHSTARPEDRTTLPTRVDALLSLVNETNPATRAIAVSELNRTIARGHETAELYVALHRHLPRLTESIQAANDPGVLTDLLQLGGALGEFGGKEHKNCVGAPAAKDRSATVRALGGAILGRLYLPHHATREDVAEAAVIALARFPREITPMIAPLLEGLEHRFPTNRRIEFACAAIRSSATHENTPPPNPPKGFSSLYGWLGFRAMLGKPRWGDAEAAAVRTLVGSWNDPAPLPPPFDPASSALATAHEHRIQEAIRVLGRFGARAKGSLDIADGVQGATALTTCIGSPLHDSAALTALKSYGAAGGSALPALLELAGSRRSSHSTRGEALETSGHIIAATPTVDFKTEHALVGRFIEITTRCLHSSNPLLIQRALHAVVPLGDRGAPLAPAVEYALRSDLAATPSPGEDEDAAIQPIALVAIEALAAIDPSGHTVAQVFTRIFESARTPDDIRHQLILAVGELAEREELTVPIVDVITARMIESRYLPGYLAQEGLAMVQRVEDTLDLHPAELPLSSTALLRSRGIDTAAKESYLVSLTRRAELYPTSVIGIVMGAYPELSPVARLDDIAIETLRRLQRR